MEAAHRRSAFAVDDILHGAHDAQRMKGKLIQLRAAAVEQLALMLAVGEGSPPPAGLTPAYGDTPGQFVQGRGDIADQLDIRGVVALFISGQHVDMHQRRVAVIHIAGSFDRAVADADDQVGEVGRRSPAWLLNSPTRPAKRGNAAD
jgi:hypothetical protein